MHIRVKKGLNIPIAGGPNDQVRELESAKVVCLDVSSHELLRLTSLVKPGDYVKGGQALLEDKQCKERIFVAPTSGTVKEIIRGEKRRILHISIDADVKPAFLPLSPLASLTKEALHKRFVECGLFSLIFQRPFHNIADPNKDPEAIFVNAVQSAPFAASPEWEIEREKDFFEKGLLALQQLTAGTVHVVSQSPIVCPDRIVNHTIEGPHPIGNASLHIAYLHPIRTVDQVIWTLNAHDVITIGASVCGQFYQRKLISLAGLGVRAEKRAFCWVYKGQAINEILDLNDGDWRIISGDPLTGREVGLDGFLGQNDFTVCALPLHVKRAPLHFFGAGWKRYTATRAYLSAFLPKKEVDLTVSQHGEMRPFVDGAYYDKVMPLKIPTMPLIKALMADDFEKAIQLGFLEVAPEDFALPAFICPSKIAMGAIVKQAQQRYIQQYLD